MQHASKRHGNNNEKLEDTWHIGLGALHEANTQRLWHSSEASATLLRQRKHSKTKHLEIRHHFLRDHVVKEDIDIIHVNTEEQLADIFTKPLDEKRFCKLRCELNILESSNVL